MLENETVGGTYIWGVGLVGSWAATAPRKSTWSEPTLWSISPLDVPGCTDGPAAGFTDSFFGESASHVSVDNRWIWCITPENVNHNVNISMTTAGSGA